MGNFSKKFAILVLLGFCFACSQIQGAQKKQQEVTPEQAKQQLNDLGQDFLYGPGLGKTALAVGSTVIFPPFGIYMLANGLLELGDYQTYYLTDALPKPYKDTWNETYENVASAPGRVAASIASKEYRTEEVMRARYAEEPSTDLKASLNKKVSATKATEQTKKTQAAKKSRNYYEEYQ